MGLALAQAQGWIIKRSQDLPSADLEFVNQSIKREALGRTRSVYVVGFNGSESLRWCL